jgi:hypothetical protein
MPDIRQAIDDWFAAHFSHLTPGTPDHFTASRAKADLLARLSPAPAVPETPSET